MASSFLYRDDGPEPHGPRRRALLLRHPELRELVGHSYLTSAIIFAIVAVQLVIAALVQAGANAGAWTGSWWFVVILAYAVGATLNHWAGMGIHEASHRLVARTRLGNRLVALVANIPIVFPAAMSFWRYHGDHHRHLGIEGIDNDLASAAEIRVVGRSPWRKALWLLLYPVFAAGARGFVRKPERWEMIGLAAQLVEAFLIQQFIGKTGLVYLALSTFFGFGLLHPVAAHFIHEHYIWKPGQETYSYYGPLNWVTFHVGYHNEHHDLPAIACWRLPRLRATAPEFYRDLASHRSWARVLFQFVFNREIGHDARIARGRTLTT
jgi:sphingolipid 4-desaturase/C4-monooxygenase